jgi:hypothetical protein
MRPGGPELVAGKQRVANLLQNGDAFDIAQQLGIFAGKMLGFPGDL